MAKDNKDLSDFDFLKKSVDQYIGTPQAKESVWDKVGRRARRKAIKEGIDVSGKDYDHKTASFKSVKSNRGNNGKGTKSEGSKNYKNLRDYGAYLC